MGVNSRDQIWYRDGIDRVHPYGITWKRIIGNLNQISVGDGNITGSNEAGNLFTRTHIDRMHPYGTGWKKIPGNIKNINARMRSLIVMENAKRVRPLAARVPPRLSMRPIFNMRTRIPVHSMRKHYIVPDIHYHDRLHKVPALARKWVIPKRRSTIQPLLAQWRAAQAQAAVRREKTLRTINLLRRSSYTNPRIVKKNIIPGLDYTQKRNKLIYLRNRLYTYQNELSRINRLKKKRSHINYFHPGNKPQPHYYFERKSVIPPGHPAVYLHPGAKPYNAAVYRKPRARVPAGHPSVYLHPGNKYEHFRRMQAAAALQQQRKRNFIPNLPRANIRRPGPGFVSLRGNNVLRYQGYQDRRSHIPMRMPGRFHYLHPGNKAIFAAYNQQTKRTQIHSVPRAPYRPFSVNGLPYYMGYQNIRRRINIPKRAGAAFSPVISRSLPYSPSFPFNKYKPYFKRDVLIENENKETFGENHNAENNRHNKIDGDNVTSPERRSVPIESPDSTQFEEEPKSDEEEFAKEERREEGAEENLTSDEKPGADEILASNDIENNPVPSDERSAIREDNTSPTEVGLTSPKETPSAAEFASNEDEINEEEQQPSNEMDLADVEETNGNDMFENTDLPTENSYS